MGTLISWTTLWGYIQTAGLNVQFGVFLCVIIAYWMWPQSGMWTQCSPKVTRMRCKDITHNAALKEVGWLIQALYLKKKKDFGHICLQSEHSLWFILFHEAGIAPPMGGVDRGGRRRDLSLADMAAISGSCVSYILTNLANFRTPLKISRHVVKTIFGHSTPSKLHDQSTNCNRSNVNTISEIFYIFTAYISWLICSIPQCLST